MSFLLIILFQDVVGLWGKLADQGIAIAVLIVIGVFGLLVLNKLLPVWERVKTSESNSRNAQAEAFNNMAAVIKDIAVEQRKANETTKILHRVNASSTEQLASHIESFSEKMDQFGERLEKLESQKL